MVKLGKPSLHKKTRAMIWTHNLRTVTTTTTNNKNYYFKNIPKHNIILAKTVNIFSQPEMNSLAPPSPESK